MPWARIDDNANGDAKLLALSDAAFRLWVCGLIYCQATLSNGFVPRHVLQTFGIRGGGRHKLGLARELCTPFMPERSPLWREVEGGYQVHDYLQWNLPREHVLERRQLEKTRRELYFSRDLLSTIRDRDADRCRYCGQIVNWKDRRSPQGGTYDHVDSTLGNSPENVVVACRGCNAAKGRRTPQAAGMQLLPAPSGDDGVKNTAELTYGKSVDHLQKPTRKPTHHVPVPLPQPRTTTILLGTGTAPLARREFPQAVQNPVENRSGASPWKRAVAIAHQVLEQVPDRTDWTEELKNRCAQQGIDYGEIRQGRPLYARVLDYVEEQRRRRAQ